MFVEKYGHEFCRLVRPRIIAAHRAAGLRARDGATSWDEPEMARGSGSHAITQGQVNTIREIPAAYATDLAAIDAEWVKLEARLAELRRDEKTILELAYTAGKPVTVDRIHALARAEG